MASAPQANLPLFYKDLMPLNSRDHSKYRSRTVDKASWVGSQNAIPLTTDEFALAQRDFPIVFSAGDDPVPLALMGLNENVNVFFDDDGAARGEFYVPAYIRRYPFMLARLDQSSDQMSLCFDPTSEVIGEFDDGNAMFDGDQPTQHTQDLLKFNENFEEAGARTRAFVEELRKHNLIMDGEVSIQQNERPDQPYIYRGFQMVDQNKLREMRGDQLRKWNEIGILPLIYAHLFSLDLMRVIFARQTEQGKGPGVAGSEEQKAALAAGAAAANA